VTARTTTTPRFSASRITPSAIEEKYGSVTSCTIRPITLLVPRAIAWAWAFAV